DRFIGGPYASDESAVARFENNPMFAVLAVRTVLSQQDLSNQPGMRYVGRDLDTVVWEDTEAYPRAWVVHDVVRVRSEDAAFAHLQTRGHVENGVTIVDGFDPRSQAVVEAKRAKDLRALQAGSGCDPAGDHVTVEKYTGNTVALRVDAACAGLLVLPDTYFPDWDATVNGRNRPIHPTAGAFRGIAVPAGRSTLSLSYPPLPITSRS